MDELQNTKVAKDLPAAAPAVAHSTASLPTPLSLFKPSFTVDAWKKRTGSDNKCSRARLKRSGRLQRTRMNPRILASSASTQFPKGLLPLHAGMTASTFSVS